MTLVDTVVRIDVISGPFCEATMSTYSIAQAKYHLSRLVDEALEGKQVTITRHGKPLVELRPAATGRPVTMKDIEWLRKCRKGLPSFEGDTVTEIRAMRDDF